MGESVRARVRIRRAIARAVGVVPRPPSGGLRVLVYHSVTAQPVADADELSIPAPLLGRQLDLLRDKGYAVLPLADAITRLDDGSLPARAVTLTFDDGYADNHELLLPVLERQRVVATVFLPAAVLAGGLGALRYESGARFIDLGRAREMLSSGLIAFGCHSATHRNLRWLSDGDLRIECVDARARLSEILRTPIDFFAYPFGAPGTWDARVRAAVVGAGYRSAFTSIMGSNHRATDRFLMRRCRISWAEGADSFERVLEGGYDWYGAYQHLRALVGRPRGVERGSHP